MSDNKISYLVFVSGMKPMQVNCTSVEVRDGALFFMNEKYALCAFSKWDHIEIMSQITGEGNGFTYLKEPE